MYLIRWFMEVVKSSFRAECVLVGLIPIAVPAENVSSKRGWPVGSVGRNRGSVL